MKPLVLVDFSNYVYACWFPALAAQKADPKYDPHGVLKTNLKGKLGTLLRTLNDVLGWQDYTIYFVEDRKSKRKYEVWPAYKANRTALEFDPRPEAKEFLIGEGYRDFCHSPDNEADDTIASLVNQNREVRQIVICSSDKDLWQLLDPPVVNIWQLTKDRYVTPEMVTEEFGCGVEQVPLVKALWGDSGDNVPNAVPRMQKALMPIVRYSNGTLASFYDILYREGVSSKRAMELLNLNGEQIRTNWKLVKLDENCPVVIEVLNENKDPAG